MTKLHFGMSVCTDDTTGSIISAYFQIRKGKTHQTVEYADGAAFADYDDRGQLLGIEVLAPCRVSIVDKIAANEPVELRKRTKRFLRENGPRKMIAI